MKFAKALGLITQSPNPQGFRVNFQERSGASGCILTSGHFPDRDEHPIASEEEAWMLAQKFAARGKGQFVNVFVIKAENWVPVEGYQARKLNSYPLESI